MLGIIRRFEEQKSLSRSMVLLKFFIIVVIVAGTVSGHARLALPPGRSSAWNFSFPTPVNTNDFGIYCGGFQRLWQNGGKCGICGDPFDGPRDNEAPNGKYFTGNVTNTYKAGSVIDVRVEMKANHLGGFLFKICPVTNNSVEVTQDCLDQHPLEIVQAPTTPVTSYRWDIPGTYTPSVAPGWNLPAYSFKVKLPDNLACNRCVVQWDWICANRNGTSEGKQGFGYGPQDLWRGCADVRIEN